MHIFIVSATCQKCVAICWFMSCWLPCIQDGVLAGAVGDAARETEAEACLGKGLQDVVGGCNETIEICNVLV